MKEKHLIDFDLEEPLSEKEKKHPNLGNVFKTRGEVTIKEDDWTTSWAIRRNGVMCITQINPHMKENRSIILRPEQVALLYETMIKNKRWWDK